MNTPELSISDLRHELSTPINAIISDSEMLIEELAQEENSNLIGELEQINLQGNELLTRINKILEPITITQNYSVLDSHDVMETSAVVSQVIDNCQLLLKKVQEDELEQDIQKIDHSAHALQELLENLLSFSSDESDEQKPQEELSSFVPEVNPTPKSVTQTESVALLEKPITTSSVVSTGNILVVDDIENNRDLLSRLLCQEGYNVATASDGKQALQMVTTGDYDLILLDFLMPELNGYQVLQRLKDEPQWQKIPVIMISALDEVDNVVTCIEIGAEDYLTKPFNSVLLKTKIGASLEKKRLRDREQQYLQQVEEYSQKLNKEIEISRKSQQKFLSTQEQTSLIVSVEEIRFKPGFTTPSFEVTVTNHSDRFVSFMLEIIPAGVSELSNFYELSPEVSTKTPPGASSKFMITIVKNPEPGFVGMINLTIGVFSLELNTETREIVRLIVEPGLDLPALQLQLTELELQAYPDSQAIIPVSIYNPNKTPIEAKVSLSGLTFDWFRDGLEQKLTLMPKRWTPIQWTADIPELEQAIARVYNFSIQGNYENAPEATIMGSLEILPVGDTILECTPEQYRIPEKRAWLPSWFSPPMTYHVTVENVSNLPEKVNLNLEQEEYNECQLELNPPEQSVYPNQKVNFDLKVSSKRPWIGWGQEKVIDLEAILSDQRLQLNQNRKTIILKLLPIIPRWLQSIVGVFLLAGLIWWLEIPSNWLNSDTRIYSVRFNGITDEVVAGSSERLIYQWSRNKNKLASRKIIAKTDKPVRTLRYRPFDNDKLASGLENGEILIWDLLSTKKQPIYNFTYQKDDRVLSLEYTLDSRYLFSAHGSGLVLQWYVGDEDLYTLNRYVPTLKRQFDFAIYDLVLVGENRHSLAVAGRFNQLKIWNFIKDTVISLPYQEGGQIDYINSITSPAQKPFWLAIADNQGSSSLWNVESCLRGKTECEIVDSWKHSISNTTPVNSIAFSDDGCYLASAGDDGKIQLWPLGVNGKRQTQYIQGITIASVKRKINNIDLEIAEDKILIVSGENDGKVNLYNSKLINKECF